MSVSGLTMIMNACIPQQSQRCKRNLPWLTKNIVCYMRMRNAAFQAAKRKSTDFAKYKKLHNKVVGLLPAARQSYFNNINPLNKKQFWRAVKVLSKQQSTIPTLHHQGSIAKSDIEKANRHRRRAQSSVTLLWIQSQSGLLWCSQGL